MVSNKQAEVGGGQGVGSGVLGREGNSGPNLDQSGREGEVGCLC